MANENNLVPATELAAVNAMLRSIGQGTINSLVSSESVDAENAKAVIHDVSREVQERGWWFNREASYTLVPDNEGIIHVPASSLQFSPDPRWVGVVERNRKLYDNVNHTFVFPAGTQVTGTVVWFLPFEELPQAARTYIGRRAGREFQIGAVGSDLLYKFTVEMENEALAAMTRAHLRAEKPNAFLDDHNSYYTARGFRTRR